MKKSYLLIVLAAFLWGCIGIFYKQLSSLGFSSMQIVAIRCTVAAICMVLFLLFKQPTSLRIRLRDCWYFVGTGIFSLVFFNWCYFSAMEFSSLGVAAVLLYTSPIFVMVLSAIFFGEKITLFKSIALVLTLAGCVLVTGILGDASSRISLMGVLLGVGSGLGYALYSIFGRVALKNYSSMTVTTYTFVFAALCALPLSGLHHSLALFASPGALWSSLGLGVLCCALPFLFYTIGLVHIETGKAAILATLEPAVATVIGVAFYGETLSWIKLTGIVLIFLSILLLHASQSPKKRPFALHKSL